MLHSKGNGFLQKKNRLILRSAFFLTVFFILIFLFFAGRFLVINEKPKTVDVIVVLSGGEGRLEKGKELYESGYARKMIVSNGLADNLWGRAVTILPRSSLILEAKSDSTYESAVYVKKIMEKYHYHSAIIVSSDFHMRRVKYNFSRVYSDTKDTLIYVSSVSSYDPKNWWKDKLNVGITISEYVKIIGNTFGVYGNTAKRKLYQYVEVFFYE
ncbi:hypothetical protein COJ85_10640 [Bacillus sp. AFS076308]|uniref:YdcF family protein n=1 Tax=unclassified Bacillus (in: firmicutes) TaxID=185979 RepID=UPI000BF74441|nr:MULTISPECIES: YdcF family protein [unclassified Bacillus (in: firmicutes)]PFO04949.1 hypothetical protein COJ85_10640 [Bacillus sp. AFS076308]PGV51046.1 hypothetical protein COD92_15745 [Bacillus sp. AFS037270]